MTPPPKVYLGDSVYARVEYGALVLTTENGMGPSNTIVLEPEVYAALVRYVASLQKPDEPLPRAETHPDEREGE